MDKTTLSEQLKELFEACQVDYDADPYEHGYSSKTVKIQASKASFPDDPLALSCASYRLFKNAPERRWTNIDTVNATQEDRTMAQQIRDYYNQRYTMMALKGRQLTEYQQKTAQFLSGLHHLTTEELGLLYKLPYFYVEDTGLDCIVDSTQSYDVSPDRDHAEYTLTPVKEIFRSRKGGEIVQFWYQDQNNYPVLIECKSTDQLLNMLRGLFKQSKIQVRSYTKLMRVSGIHDHRGLRLFGWELVL